MSIGANTGAFCRMAMSTPRWGLSPRLAPKTPDPHLSFFRSNIFRHRLRERRIARMVNASFFIDFKNTFDKFQPPFQCFHTLLFIRSFLIAFVKQTTNSQIIFIVTGFTAYAVFAGINFDTKAKILPPIPEYEMTTNPSTMDKIMYTRLPFRVKNVLIFFIS